MRTLLFLHLLGAAIWVGGHLVLALGILPGALRRRDPQAIRAFEQVYERIGIPALLLQVVSGLWLASLWLPFHHWFGATPVARALQLAAAPGGDRRPGRACAPAPDPEPGRREPAEAGLAHRRDHPGGPVFRRGRTEFPFRRRLLSMPT